MRKLLLSIAALLIAGAASAQPIGVRVTKDTTNSRLLVRADNGEWLGVWGSGTPSFTTFLGENVPAGAIYFNTATGTPYRFSSGSWAASSGGSAATITPGTTAFASGTDCFAFADTSSVLRCDNTLAKLDSSGTGNGVFTFRKSSLAAGADTAGFFNFTGTLTQTSSGSSINGLNATITTVGSASVVQRGLQVTLAAGYSGASQTQTIRALNQVAGTSTDFYATTGGNFGTRGESSSTTTGANIGAMGYAASGLKNVGVFGHAPIDKASGTNIGVLGNARNQAGSAFEVGVAGTLGFVTEPATWISAALLGDNMGEAKPIIVARDNTAALPTTGATATWQVADGAWPQLGNGVLTNGTMAAETQARDSGSMIHSYTWTNAQIVALGAVGNGDITVATLPAKTVVKNAYVVIITPDTSANNLTVACGRTSATFLDYIGNSDAKAAANTVYGDASGERGANLTGYDLPSYTTTTDVKCHFIKTTTTLDTVLGSTGRVILETSLVP